MRQVEKFMQYYKEYESLLRSKGKDPKEIEESSEDAISHRLWICRQMRNFLAHNHDPGFLSISDDQLEFLQQQIMLLQFEDDILRKHLRTPASGSCAENDRCSDVIEKMRKAKLHQIVVRTDISYGIADLLDVVSAAMKSKATKMSSVKTTARYKICRPELQMSDIPQDSILICTDTGTRGGKLLGIYYPGR